MKYFICLFFFLVLGSSEAVQNAANLPSLDPFTRLYFVSVENGMMGEAAWKSNTNATLSTATYTGTTSTLYYNIKLVDDDSNKMYWFNDAISGWSVSSTAGATVGGPALTTAILQFKAGSAGVGITLTGTWSIGNSITLSAPAISTGVLSVSTAATQVLTFTQ